MFAVRSSQMLSVNHIVVKGAAHVFETPLDREVVGVSELGLPEVLDDRVNRGYIEDYLRFWMTLPF